jgi:hypothetical protein
MAGRHAYWVIVTGNDATAFRARRPEDLLPTLKQLQRTQPDATLKWFERSRIWDSPEQALAALKAGRRTTPARNREWRPGGDHRDPRAKYQLTRDEKRARFKKRRSFRSRPENDPPNDRTDRPPQKRTKSFGARPSGPKTSSGFRPRRPAGPRKRRG